jgi:hypothetical protein
LGWRDWYVPNPEGAGGYGAMESDWHDDVVVDSLEQSEFTVNRDLINSDHRLNSEYRV